MSINQTKTTHKIVLSAVIAAIYAIITSFIAPIAYGPLQCRISEALTVLPVFSGVSVWGLGVGCAIANLYGIMSGSSILGMWDVLFGTLATVLAALCTYAARKIRLKGLPILSMLFPVVFNAVIIGAELTILSGGGKLTAGWSTYVFFLNAAYVAVGEAVAAVGGGLVLYLALSKTKLFDNI